MSVNKPTSGATFAPLQNAEIEWQADGEPWSPLFHDVYFSRAGGMDETRYVFLQGNALAARWKALAERDGSCCFTIAELGFGTGLNFLCSWQLWRHSTASKQHRLHFISCEKHPLRHVDLARALQHWPELAPLAQALLAVYPEHSPGYHRLLLTLPGDTDPAVTLDLYYGDANDLLAAQANQTLQVDAWFLDGFTPAQNPELWQDKLLETVASFSAAGTTLASYSVTGRVVRKLRELGCAVEKRKGFDHKRHMLHASWPEPKQPSAQKTRVLVIGAGLAGCSVAWSLARRGYAVTVIEREAQAAAGASGNPQAILQCRLNRLPDAQWLFNLQAFLFAAHYYQWLSDSGAEFDWQRCGVLTLAAAYQNTRPEASAADYAHYPPQVLQALDQQQAGRISGLAVSSGGLFMPDGGWLNPSRLCQQLLNHPGITLRADCPVADIEFENNNWHLYDEQHRLIDHAATLVLCNSYALRRFEQGSALPLIPLRGQISMLPASAASTSQHSVICGKSYLAPASCGSHCIGASYVKNSEDTTLSQQESETVVAALADSVPLIAAQQQRAVPGRAAIRGQSGDFMPIAGAVPHPASWQGLFGGAQHSSEHSPALHSERLPGLYVSAGHGSHGMASCPLLAEHVAALISREASPLDTAQAALVDPWRFVLRHRRRLRRQQQTDQSASG